MPTFQYANPNVIHWGAGIVREKLDAELQRIHARRVLVVTTQSALFRLLPAIEELIGDRLVERAVVGQHAPVESLMDAVKKARLSQVDALVSLGGGSPIDGAKAVAFSLATGVDLRLPDAQARCKGLSLETILPHLAIPTTLSVAELSSSAGFSAVGSRAKVGVAASELKPAAVFYDAELAVQTPLPLWLTTGVRALDHAVETLLTPGDHPLPDAAALEGLRRLQRGLLAAHDRPDDLAARTEGQLGAWFSYLMPGPAASGLSHTLGKKIGSPYGIPHGVTSSLLLPHVLRYLAPSHPAAAARIAEVLGARDAATGLEELLDKLEVPRHLAQWNLTDAQLAEAARAAAGNAYPEADLLSILRAAH